jgi:hypothetical protein
MLFKTNYKGRHWSPFLLELSKSSSKYSLENYGNDLQFTDGDLILLVKNVENGYKITAKDAHSIAFLDAIINQKLLNEEGILEILQNKEGLDLEDRIYKCRIFLEGLSALGNTTN